MRKNIGGLDRALRVIVGVGLIGAAAAGHIGAWGYIGVIPLGTALVGFCPLYSMLGLTTRPGVR